MTPFILKLLIQLIELINFLKLLIEIRFHSSTVWFDRTKIRRKTSSLLAMRSCLVFIIILKLLLIDRVRTKREHHASCYCKWLFSNDFANEEWNISFCFSVCSCKSRYLIFLFYGNVIIAFDIFTNARCLRLLIREGSSFATFTLTQGQNIWRLQSK